MIICSYEELAIGNEIFGHLIDADMIQQKVSIKVIRKSNASEYVKQCKECNTSHLIKTLDCYFYEVQIND